MAVSAFPWYETISGEDLEQGDILEGCPVYLPPEEVADGAGLPTPFEFEERDVIVLTQTCDLVRGREKVSQVVVCSIWALSEFGEGLFSTPRGREDVRRGNLPAYHMIGSCDLPDFRREIRIVDFRQLYSLPLGFARKRAGLPENRLRLLPPYREHLAQAFARYFMRVGLPIDIPPFK